MFKAGDVVLGSFATKNGVINHYSVVLQATAEASMLVYTTSLKAHSSSSQVFTQADMELAGWSKPCRWDASSLSIVPNDRIRKVGRISAKTLEAIKVAYLAATKQRSVVVVALEETGELVCA